ncbi:hypothetical protein F383_29869 [Gossypium arboreum]|uniref:Uncharacterized protein n=1 Tax=Gossypium arboreum TaxID=29729 RepID=A0A0B0MUM4_GOSAR|nr:hypothetical protein F383_29869 [Gossypium arboreum]
MSASVRHVWACIGLETATADDMESNALAPAEGTAPVESEPRTMGQDRGAREAYLQMMDAWYMKFVRANPNTPPLLPPLIPQYTPVALTKRICSAPLRGRPQKNPRSGAASRGAPRDAAVRFEGRAPIRTYTICACEEAESPNMIVGHGIGIEMSASVRPFLGHGIGILPHV